MKKLFVTKIFGYSKKQVDQYIRDLKKDYEDELYKKKERMTELIEENRRQKLEIEAQKERIERFIDQEKYISRALVKAEQRAQSIVEDGQHKAEAAMSQAKLDSIKWQEKARETRSKLLAFDLQVAEVIERLRSEINYYAAKEISETLLVDDDDADKDINNLDDVKKAV